MKIQIILAACAATLSGSLAASAASAQAPAAGERIVVSYSDLDLASATGIARLNRRILTAAQAACGPTSDSDPHGRNLAQSCRHRVFDQASSQARRAIALARPDGPTLLAGR